ncbi:MAG: hypothetical protein ACI9C1_002848 [Candidatus Aldehydirespiratoraceae bacterium]|jgi:hypothetical protein
MPIAGVDMSPPPPPTPAMPAPPTPEPAAVVPPPPPPPAPVAPTPPPVVDQAPPFAPTAPPLAPTPAPAAPPATAPEPPVPAQPMPDASSGPGLTDPSGLGAAVGRLSGASRKAGHAAFMVLARSLEEGEQVATVTSCRFRGAPGALALTDRRLLVVNAREWEPDILPVGMEPGLTVKGWQDEKRAALVFVRDGHELVVDQILDRSMAQEIATGVRARAGG